jgi:hypothetical protein
MGRLAPRPKRRPQVRAANARIKGRRRVNRKQNDGVLVVIVSVGFERSRVVEGEEGRSTRFAKIIWAASDMQR